jgi:3-dehydroquinate synthase
MIEIKLNLKPQKRSYPILLGENVVDELPSILKKQKVGQKYCIITDSTVLKLYGEPLFRHLKKNGINAEIISFPKGEKQKNLQTIEKLAEKLIQKKFTRKDALIALGGGVVGDIVGFLASVYMRGIPVIQIPTTLLAMVDSSVGGKTGVNLSKGKNLIGAFHHPIFTFIDIAYLKKLPEKQIKNGLAEVIKYSVIADASLFNFIEQNVDKILVAEKNSILKIIQRSIEIKAKIIEEDENEKGERMKLNYGHSFGHLLEKLSGYTLLHGYAVSIGMVLVNKIAVQKGLLSKSDAERIKNLLKKSGLPITTMQKLRISDLSNDKKAEDGYINLVYPKKIGDAVILKEKLCQ